MSNIGDAEREIQNRVVQFFKEELKYAYLGNWEYRKNNSNIETEHLEAFFNTQGYSKVLIKKAIDKLEADTTLTGKDLYYANKDVYRLLRYGAKVRENVGDIKETIFFIDWKNPKNNNFAIAEEVTITGKYTKRPDVVLYMNSIAGWGLRTKESH